MTREHLMEDIRNVLELAGPPIGAGEAERIRNAFRGLLGHVRAEPDVPQRVTHCLAESVRVLEKAGAPVSDDAWDYARTCLEAALDYADPQSPLAVPPPRA